MNEMLQCCLVYHQCVCSELQVWVCKQESNKQGSFLPSKKMTERVNVPGSLCLCTCCAIEGKQGNPFSTKGRLISGLCGAFGCWVFEAKEGWDLT